ncbi:HpcH/HpaI aldolase/citrate lyase family protein [Ramlibacter sp.]|uniref:HpcH/HpaI aldolase/citrate lyase family protein n=1 Tax=Ramlibacter sp. TaxID=1917967 RepID=UPI003D131431
MTTLISRKTNLRRTQLITPCDNAWDLMNKAARSKTDIVRLELEDGVVPERKNEARGWALRGLREIDWGDKEVWVRITHFDYGYAEADIDTLVQGQPNVIVMGKCQGLDDMLHLDKMIAAAERRHGIPVGTVKMGCVIERIRAVHKVEDLAACSPRMSMMCCGLDDLSNEYGYRLTRMPADALETLYVRSRVVLAARLAGITAVDYPYLKYRDLEASEIDARFSARLGFHGKQIISPAQAEGVHRAFAPTEKELAWAKAILRAVEENKDSGAAVFIVDGEMIDAPHILQARTIMQRQASIE